MRLALLSLFLLAGCETAHPTMIGSVKHEVVVQGLRFVTFQKGDEVEVLRMGYLKRSERAGVQALMAEAAAATTGCRVIPDSIRTRIPGDSGEAMFDLDC